MNYIIGDVHNNIRELEKLLALLKPTASDTVIFVGDYVDKNSDTEQTVSRLLALRQECTCVFLKGNHEYVWEAYFSGDASRQKFLLTYGGVETLREYSSDAQALLKDNRIDDIRAHLASYSQLIALTKDYHMVGNYVALHAGLRPEQLGDQTLRFVEANYFLRPDQMNLDRRYLDTYTLVAGHTHVSDIPWRKNGYINIDLGAAYGKQLGAFVVEEGTVIRSDGKIFSV